MRVIIFLIRFAAPFDDLTILVYGHDIKIESAWALEIVDDFTDYAMSDTVQDIYNQVLYPRYFSYGIRMYDGYDLDLYIYKPNLYDQEPPISPY